MKKIKSLNLRLGDAKSLTKQQLKNIMGGTESSSGGGDCCWHTTNWSEYSCDLSQGEAQGKQQSSGGWWCCTSCRDSCQVYREDCDIIVG